MRISNFQKLSFFQACDGSSSSTSVYSTAEEDHFDSEESQSEMQDEVIEPLFTSTKAYVTGSNVLDDPSVTDETDSFNSLHSAITQKINNTESFSASSTTSSTNPLSGKLINTLQNVRNQPISQNEINIESYYSSSQDSSVTATNSSGKQGTRKESTPFQLGEISFQYQSESSDLLTLSDSESCTNIAAASLLLSEGKTISAVKLQEIFDRFKTSQHSLDYYVCMHNTYSLLLTVKQFKNLIDY